MKETNITVCSMHLGVGDFSGNRQKILSVIDEAKKQNSSLVITPELSITGYGMEDFFTYPEVIEQAKKELLKITHQMPEKIIAMVGLPILHEGRLYNSVATIEKSRILGLTFKRNLASNGIHYEQRWFTPWESDENTIVTIDMGLEQQQVLSGSPIIEFGGFRVGVEICEDGWVSNRIAQKYFERNVDIIANPSASHFAAHKFETRKRLVQDSSRAYGVVYAYSNICGCESGRAIYDGGSMIYSSGNELGTGERLHFSKYELLTRTVTDVANQASRMQTSQRYSERRSLNSEFPAVKSSRQSFEDYVTMYHEKSNTEVDNCWNLGVPSSSYLCEYTEIVRAISLALADWSYKTGTNGYTVSLSGGADSTLTSGLVHLSALLEIDEFIKKGIPLKDARIERFIDFDLSGMYRAADIAEKVMKNYLTTAYQPSDNSGSVTRTAADEFAKEIGANHHILTVGHIIEGYEKEFNESFGTELNWEEHDITKQNIQARARSPMIWLPANYKNALLLTTSNLSEASVGYVTQDGDSSGVLAPISGITKTKVRGILRFLEDYGLHLYTQPNFFKYESLKHINNQAPTAELRPVDQTDEDDLMPFDILDFILEKSMQDNFNPLSVYRLVKREFIKEDESKLAEYVLKFYRHFFRNQWKRDRQAPGFHVLQGSLDPKTYKRIPLLCKMYEDELKELEKKAKAS